MPTRHRNKPDGATIRSRSVAAPRMTNGSSAIELGLQTQQRSLVEAACHDFRQPLQSLVLLQAMLARRVEGAELTALVARLDDALNVMTSIVQGLAEPLPRTSAAVVQSQSCSHVHRDVKAQFTPAEVDSVPVRTTIFVVDDDAGIRQSVADVLELEGLVVKTFASCEDFIARTANTADGCLLVDAYLPGMSGLDLLLKIQADGFAMPAIMITGNSDVPMAVQAMKAGAVDFIEKPFRHIELLACIDRAMELSRDQQQLVSWRLNAATQLSALTDRQREILEMVLAGHPSKNIAADLGISQRTVENHRASIMKRTGATSLPELARLAVAAASAMLDTSAQHGVAQSFLG